MGRDPALLRRSTLQSPMAAFGDDFKLVSNPSNPRARAGGQTCGDDHEWSYMGSAKSFGSGRNSYPHNNFGAHTTGRPTGGEFMLPPDFQPAHAHNFASINPTGAEQDSTVFNIDRLDELSANLSAERNFPGTFQGVQHAFRREAKQAASRRQVMRQTGRLDVPPVADVAYQPTPDRPRRMTAPSHARSIPLRATTRSMHIPSVAGTRHNTKLPSSEAEIEGHHRFQRGDFPGAKKCYVAALQESPKNAFVLRCLASTLGHCGDLRGMLVNAEKMVEMEPWNKKSRFLLKAVSDMINQFSLSSGSTSDVSRSALITVATLFTPDELKASSHRARMMTHPQQIRKAKSFFDSTLVAPLSPDVQSVMRSHHVNPDDTQIAAGMRTRARLLPSKGEDQTAQSFNRSSRPYWEQQGLESRSIHRKQPAPIVPGSTRRCTHAGPVAVRGLELQTQYGRGVGGVPLGGFH